jgi:nucleoside-diphosphate-sugar epimerase
MDAPQSFWHGRRVLLTGCTGFLGGAVARELLTRGADVVGLVRGPRSEPASDRAGVFRPIHGRVEDTFRLCSALAVHEIQAVFHLAAGGLLGLDHGAAAVVEAVRRFDPRVPVVTARPSDGFALARRNPPVPLGVARFGGVFGPGDGESLGVVPSAIAGLLRNAIPQRTSGAARDFVFVRDAASACLMLAESLAPEPHLRDETFRTGWGLTDHEMAVAVRDVSENRTRPPIDPPKNPCGWRPAMSFAGAVNETIAWYRDRAPVQPPQRKAA